MLANEEKFTHSTPPETKPKRRGSAIKKLLIAFVVVGAFFGGFRAGEGRLDLPPAVINFVDRGREGAPAEVDWTLLWDSIDLINKKYVNRPADMQKVLFGAVSGAVNALGDPYSVFMPPQQAQEFREELSGSLEGIGAEIAIKHERLTVVSPIDGSPALKAGIRGGDYIIEVNGESTQGLSIGEAVSKIRGPSGTSVKLLVLHLNGQEPVEINIVRAQIIVKSVESEIRTVSGRKIGIMRVRRFGEDTTELLQKAAQEFLSSGVQGIIFDVRNNPGGFLESAIDVASLWVKNGETVLIQKTGDGTEKTYPANGQGKLGSIPTVVLMNGGSASASEIVSGALRDHNLAKLIGLKSFGKGSVQELLDLGAGSQLKLTIAKWLTPAGHDLNKDGLEPDIKVDLTDSDFQDSKDPQLDKAFEELTK